MGQYAHDDDDDDDDDEDGKVTFCYLSLMTKSIRLLKLIALVTA